MIFKLREVEIELYQGDITELSTDAIVNAANNRGFMGGGVAGAIKRKGGKIIEDEAIKQCPIPVGEAIVTTGGKLKARYVIHAAGMGMDFKTDATKIRNATANALRRAEELKLESIAFPSIGTGVGGFPVQDAAKVMLDAVCTHIDKGTGLKKIVFALYDKHTYQAFETELKNRIAET